MSKIKAYFVAVIIVILAGGFLYSLWEHEIWSYYVAIQVFGWYGLLQAGLHMAGWLMKDDREPQKAKRSFFDWAKEEDQ